MVWDALIPGGMDKTAAVSCIRPTGTARRQRFWRRSSPGAFLTAKRSRSGIKWPSTSLCSSVGTI